MASILTRIERLEGAPGPKPSGEDPTPEELEQARQVLADLPFVLVMDGLQGFDPEEVKAWLHGRGDLPLWRGYHDPDKTG